MKDKRQQIGVAATRAIQKDGIRSVSFRTLADEVGVKSASVHYHFPTKSDLALAVVSDYIESFRERLAAIDRTHHTLKGRLNAFVGIFEAVLANQDLCLCGMMASEMTSLDNATQEALRRFFGDTERWLTQGFEHYRSEILSDLAADQLARILMSGLEGALLLDRIDGGNDRIRAFRALMSTIIR